MEKKEVEIGKPIEISGIKLIPVIEVSLRYWYRKGGISFLGIKQPLSVVVISPSGKKVFKVSGEEVPLDELMKEAPGIKKRLDAV